MCTEFRKQNLFSWLKHKLESGVFVMDTWRMYDEAVNLFQE